MSSIQRPLRVVWSLLGEAIEEPGQLLSMKGRSARLVTDREVEIGAELRLEIRDARGVPIALGLARVESLNVEGGLDIEVLAAGMEPALIAELMRGTAPIGAPLAPPPMPSAPPSPQSIGRMREEPSGAEISPLKFRKKGTIIGIDLGTTNTCASYVLDGHAKIIPGRTGTSTIPSMITFEPDGTFHVGQRAHDRQVLHPLRTVYGTKRLLGRTYRPELAEDMQRYFAYPLGEAEGQRFGVRIDDRVISMDTIAARILDEVRQCAELHLKTAVESAVITVPAYFTEVQREAVRRAAAQAKLAVHRIVNEPTAAAVAYGHKQRDKARIAVWDYGGGTFDFSIVDVRSGELQVVATGGDNFVGGSDFDDLIASYLIEEFCRQHKIEFTPDAQQVARLRDEAAQAKKRLSEEDEITLLIGEMTREPHRNLRAHLTREQFEQMAAPLIARTVEIAQEVMQASGIAPSQIDDVILVGGTTRIPAVQKSVQDLFKKRPSKRINPDEAVAIGAALLAAEVASGAVPTLLDILPMSVGRATTGRRFEPIVPRYTPLPVRREIAVEADILGSVLMPLFQGDSADVTQSEYLCSVLIEDRALWDGGKVIIRISFDEHCVMHVDARDAKTGKRLPVTLDRSRAVEDVLRDLGVFTGPEVEKPFKLPQTVLGRAIDGMFKMFGRR